MWLPLCFDLPSPLFPRRLIRAYQGSADRAQLVRPQLFLWEWGASGLVDQLCYHVVLVAADPEVR